MHTTNNHNEIAIPNLKRTNTLNKNNLIAKSTHHLDLIMEDPSQPVSNTCAVPLSPSTSNAKSVLDNCSTQLQIKIV